MREKEWEELIKDLATGLARAATTLMGLPIILPVGLLIILARKYHEIFREDPFKVGIEKLRAQAVYYTKLEEEYHRKLEEAKRILNDVELGKVGGNIDLLKAKVNQLEKEWRMIGDKHAILSLVLMVRERAKFYERTWGRGIWKKISDFPSKVWKEKLQETLSKHNERELNIRAFRNYFLRVMSESAT